MAISKKNWLFNGDAQASERSPIIYTVIGSCRQCEFNPFAYLRGISMRHSMNTN